jgi:ABC-type lipoprotein export system ATPase subunit
VSLTFEIGELHAVTGPPRSGKTLLLHLLGLLDEPDFGEVELFGELASPAPEETRREMRNSVFGYVFQSPCLLAEFTVAENIAMPLFRIFQTEESLAQMRVCELLERFGIDDSANDPVAALDPDRQFLVALARALVHRPRILLLAEPARPALLAPAVRHAVDSLGVTTIWAGEPGDWTAQCDQEIRLEHGCIVAPLTP